MAWSHSHWRRGPLREESRQWERWRTTSMREKGQADAGLDEVEEADLGGGGIGEAGGGGKGGEEERRDESEQAMERRG